MDADVAHRMWLGELNVAVALANGDVRARGPNAKILAVVPLVKPAQPALPGAARGGRARRPPGLRRRVPGLGGALRALARGGDELAHRVDVVRAAQGDGASGQEERHPAQPELGRGVLLGGDVVLALAGLELAAQLRRRRGPGRRR